jgi:hypothetical protein
VIKASTAISNACMNVLGAIIPAGLMLISLPDTADFAVFDAREADMQ